ncbi:MAG: gamma-glutamylcyclotransferase family protein [Bacteroidia bacterium]|nr:gamma-glutamylcyclotransferase family protein [Bacteroidia bacterium]
MKPLLFAYGTLREASKLQEARFLRASAKRIARAKLPARLYDLGEYPGVRYSRKKTDRVVGEVFELTENPRAVLKYLDAYEGEEYVRKKYLVELETGGKVEAWVYEYVGPLDGKRLIASGDYLKAG